MSPVFEVFFISVPRCLCQSLRMVHGQAGLCLLACVIKLHAALHCFRVIMMYAL
jgi:hypothetical protein